MSRYSDIFIKEKKLTIIDLYVYIWKVYTSVKQVCAKISLHTLYK